MLQNVLSNLKSIKPSTLAKELRSIDPKSLALGIKDKAQENLESLKPEKIKTRAAQAVSQAMASGEEEILKAVRMGADKVISGRDDVTEEVKTEIQAIATEFEMTPRGALEHLKGAGGFLKAHIPKSIDDVKNFRTNVALALISEAQKRIAARKAEEVTGKGRKHSSHEGTEKSSTHGAANGAAPHKAEASAQAAEETVSTRDGEVDATEHPRIERGGRRRKHANKDAHGDETTH